MVRSRWLLIIAAVWSTGCGADPLAVDAGPRPDAVVSAIDAVPGPDAIPAPLIGRIELAELGTQGSARVEFLQDGFPQWQVETMAVGSCRLLEAMPAFCQNPCAGLCVADDVCEPLPTRLSAGDIVMSGLATALTLEARPGGAYSSVPYPVPDDLFSAGATVTANAAGADVPAFEVSTTSVGDLTSNVPTGQITLTDDADFTFAWSPTGNTGGRVRLHIDVPAAAHGLPLAAVVLCDVPETTTNITLPKEIIAKLPAMDGSEDACGNINCGRRVLERYTSASVTTSAGRVELRLVSGQPLFITH